MSTIFPIEKDVANSTTLVGFGDLLSIDDLTKIFGVSKKTIYKEIKEGKFGVPIKIGRAYKIPKIYVLCRYFLLPQKYSNFT